MYYKILGAFPLQDEFVFFFNHSGVKVFYLFLLDLKTLRQPPAFRLQLFFHVRQFLRQPRGHHLECGLFCNMLFTPLLLFGLQFCSDFFKFGGAPLDLLARRRFNFFTLAGDGGKIAGQRGEGFIYLLVPPLYFSLPAFLAHHEAHLQCFYLFVP